MPTQKEDNDPRFIIRGQYIKDLSFENPLAPQSLLPSETRPKIDFNIDLKVRKLQDDMFELTLSLQVKAKADSQMLFLLELAYAGLFNVINVPEDKIEPLMLVDAPFVLFPFARRVVADITRDGGFPPLMLDPIDFHALYQQNRNQIRAGA